MFLAILLFQLRLNNYNRFSKSIVYGQFHHFYSGFRQFSLIFGKTIEQFLNFKDSGWNFWAELS